MFMVMFGGSRWGLDLTHMPTPVFNILARGVPNQMKSNICSTAQSARCPREVSWRMQWGSGRLPSLMSSAYLTWTWTEKPELKKQREAWPLGLPHSGGEMREYSAWCWGRGWGDCEVHSSVAQAHQRLRTNHRTIKYFPSLHLTTTLLKAYL